jgi:hypothetical protein
VKENTRNLLVSIKLWILRNKLSLCLLFVLVVSFWFFQIFPPYDPILFRVFLSVAAEGVATVLAIIISGTIIIVEWVQTRSPRAIDAFPRVSVLGLLAYYVAVLIFDWVLLLLPAVPHSFLYPLGIWLNTALAMVSVLYMMVIIEWSQPNILLKWLLKKAKSAKTEAELTEYIWSLEEIGLMAAKNLHLKSIFEVLEAYGDMAVSVSLWSEREGQGGFRVDVVEWETTQPWLLLIVSLSRLGRVFVRNRLSGAISRLAHAYATISTNYEDQMLATWNLFSISGLADVLADCKNQLFFEGLIDFLFQAEREFKRFIDEKHFELAEEWILYITKLVRILSKDGNYNAGLRYVGEALEKITKIYEKLAPGFVNTLRSWPAVLERLMQEINQLERDAKERFVGLLDYKPSHWDKSLQEIIHETQERVRALQKLDGNK